MELTLGDHTAEILNEISPDTIPWKVLIVDDDDLTRSVVWFALKYFPFVDRKFKIFQAISQQAAIDIFEKEPHIALILIEVVNGGDPSPLDFIDYVRHQKQNHLVQILLHTDQPTLLPEEKRMRSYQIGGYLLKSDSDKHKIISLLMNSLRTYRELLQLDLYRGMSQRLQNLFPNPDDLHLRCPYERKILEELCDVIGMEAHQIQRGSAVYGYIRPHRRKSCPTDSAWEQKLGYAWDLRAAAIAACSKDHKKYDQEHEDYDQKEWIYFLSTLGRFEDLTGFFPTPFPIKEAIDQAHSLKQNIYEKNYCLIYYNNPVIESRHRGIHFLYLEQFPEFEKEIVDFFFVTLHQIIANLTRGFT